MIDSFCQMKIALLLHYAVLSSTPFVRRKLGIRQKIYFFFNLHDGAEYTFLKDGYDRGELIDVLEASCEAVKNQRSLLSKKMAKIVLAVYFIHLPSRTEKLFFEYQGNCR